LSKKTSVVLWLIIALIGRTSRPLPMFLSFAQKPMMTFIPLAMPASMAAL